MSDPHRITTLEQLRAVIPPPNPLVGQKVLAALDDQMQGFIARAPLLFLATVDAAGNIDVSPKGDAPGFVAVEDDRTVLVPDRPGNHLAYGFTNILANPAVGLILVVPATRETLRINGTAELTRDPALLERLAAQGKPAVLCTRVRIRECFFHCGKALIRSRLWQADAWSAPGRVDFGRQLARAAATGMAGAPSEQQMAEQINAIIDDDYRNNLY